VSLKLRIRWPLVKGTLELISSRNCRIRSLRIFHEGTTPFTTSSFRNLNLNELQSIGFQRLPWDQCRDIMDLALQSNCRSMTFDLYCGTPNPNLFKHGLIQQVIDIGIITCSCMLSGSVIGTDIRGVVHPVDGNIQTLSELRGIPFPNIRSWRIEGKNELLASLDLSGADAINFWSDNRPKTRFLAPIPNQLTNLTLNHVIFTFESLPVGQRYILPCLTNLKLNGVVFLGPMCKYFHCPKLRRLVYDISYSCSSPNTAIEDCNDPCQVPIQQTFDKVFFHETSALEFIRLEGTTLDDNLVPILASCAVLRSLEIEDCRMERFIHPFLEALQDPKYLPSLQTFYIDTLWSTPPDLPFQNFVKLCKSTRPGITVSGNGRQESSEEYSDGDESQSDIDSDNDEDINVFNDLHS
jgi:hypothetical protein